MDDKDMRIVSLDKVSFYILYFLAVYLPFEDFLLKFLFHNFAAYMLARQAPDLIVFCLFFFVLFIKLSKIGKIRTVNKISFFSLICFVFFSLVVTLFYGSSLLISMLKLKALLRYMLLVYVLINIKINRKKIQNLFAAILKIAFLESIIGTLEILRIDSLRNFFAPLPPKDISITFTALKTQDAFGTMAYTISYGLFMTFCIALLVHTDVVKNKLLKVLLAFTYLYASYISGSRAAFITSLIILSYALYNKYKIKLVLLYTVFITIFVSLGIHFGKYAHSNEDFWFMFSPIFLDVLKRQRFGLVTKILIPFFSCKNVLFGLSPDKEFVTMKLILLLNIPQILSVILIHIIEDVFWAAMFIYYGIIGFLIFVIFIVFLYKTAIKITTYETFIKSLFLSLVLVNFVNQAFLVKTFSFYVWLSVGIALNITKESTIRN